MPNDNANKLYYKLLRGTIIFFCPQPHPHTLFNPFIHRTSPDTYSRYASNNSSYQRVFKAAIVCLRGGTVALPTRTQYGGRALLCVTNIRLGPVECSHITVLRHRHAIIDFFFQLCMVTYYVLPYISLVRALRQDQISNIILSGGRRNC